MVKTARPHRTQPEEKLSTYQSMRDFASTPEPAGRVHVNETGQLRFAIQRHRATRLHYDVRLEIDGVLVSWAVPKGPSLDPKRRSLAVKVEDHPYTYGWFEGVIPSGYGKGDVILWDDGWWEPDPDYRQDDPADCVEQGELKFILHGHKVRGRFVLVRTGGDQWLMIHKRDEEAVEGWDAEDHPHSVLSGRTNEEVRAGRPGRWPGPTKAELRELDKLDGKKSSSWTVEGLNGPVTAQLTNLDKVFMPGRDGEAPITKRDIVRYYAQIAPWIAPYVTGRPINLNRYPDGIVGAKRGFWHKAVPDHAPAWIRRWPNPLADEDRTREYLLLDGAPSLVWTANFAGIEIHPWTSTAANPEEPSYALVDIDPGPKTTWDEVVALASMYRVAVTQLGLVACPKVTGQRGIQIWIPINSGYTFHDTSRWVETISRTVGRVYPELVSWQWRKDDRRGLARLDYTQNQINKTLVAPYSMRPAPGAPVSMPISWDELDDPKLRPDRWTIRDALKRLEKVGDLFEPLVGVRQELPEIT